MLSALRIFSGMQPEGGLHVVDYLGASWQWVALCKTGTRQTIFGIANAPAITIDYEAQTARSTARPTVANVRRAMGFGYPKGLAR